MARSGNFVYSIIKKARKEGAVVRVVDDVFMSPTYSKDVSYMLRRFLYAKPVFGVYHLVNDGYCGWYGFTKAIFEILGDDIKATPIKLYELERRAKRPSLCDDEQNAR